jgi:hypothetical protein
MSPEENVTFPRGAAPAYPAASPNYGDGCPLKFEFDRILELTQDLTLAFQMLRQKRSLCSECSLVAACPFWADFDVQAQAAIRDVLREWGRL